MHKRKNNNYTFQTTYIYIYIYIYILFYKILLISLTSKEVLKNLGEK